MWSKTNTAWDKQEIVHNFNTNIIFLDIIHASVTGASFIDWAQLNRFYLKTETQSRLRNIVFYIKTGRCKMSRNIMFVLMYNGHSHFTQFCLENVEKGDLFM
jgi:hypothetical protein